MSNHNDKTFLPVTTVALIAVNVAVFLWTFLTPSGAAFHNAGAISAATIAHGEYWTLLSSMFLHGGIAHLLCNMISLYYLGYACENLFGSVRYAIIYFLSGLAGGVVYVAISSMTGDPTAAVGASGAIFGLFGAYGIVLLSEHHKPSVLASRPSNSDVSSYGGMLLFNLAYGLVVPGIAVTAHIGGMIGGAIVGGLFYAFMRRKYNEIRRINAGML